MKKAAPLERSLCSAFCSYYKPGVNESLACRGYLVAERLMQEGKCLVLKDEERADAATWEEVLVQRLCSACDFREQDCDFMQDRTRRPCGGYVLLGRMLAARVISSADLG